MKQLLQRAFHNHMIFSQWEEIAGRCSREELFSPMLISGQDILNYHALLKRLPAKQNRILILGAAPELRRLAYDFAGETIVADFSPSIIKAWSDNLPLHVRQKETILVKNWFSLGKFIPQASIDVILGDLVIREVSSCRKKEFVSSVSLLLRPGGFFITRAHHLDPRWRDASCLDIVEDAAAKYFTLASNHPLQVLFFTVARLYDKYSQPPAYTLNHSSLTQCVEFLSERLSKSIPGEETSRIVNLISKPFGGMRTPWSHIPREMFEEFVGERFITREVAASADYFDADFYPLYLLEKK